MFAPRFVGIVPQDLDQLVCVPTQVQGEEGLNAWIDVRTGLGFRLRLGFRFGLRFRLRLGFRFGLVPALARVQAPVRAPALAQVEVHPPATATRR